MQARTVVEAALSISTFVCLEGIEYETNMEPSSRTGCGPTSDESATMQDIKESNKSSIEMDLVVY